MIPRLLFKAYAGLKQAGGVQQALMSPLGLWPVIQSHSHNL